MRPFLITLEFIPLEGQGGGTLPLKSTPFPPQLHPYEGSDLVADIQ